MPAYRSILISIAMLCLTVSIAPGLAAFPRSASEYPGLSTVAPDRVYLASGTTDLDEEATIGDPGEQAAIGDPGEQTTIGDPDERARIGDPGEKSSF
jgi:hypothetical protein